VVGEVSAQIWFQSSLPHADVFVRLCDVDPQGKSWNICDGLAGVPGADELARVTVQLWPTAHRFKRGHRIRVLVSSGAFPRYGRNPGTGEPRATAARLLPATQSVYHDAEHPSSVTLPVRAVLTEAGPDRNRYADLLRVGAIGTVASGHWLLIDITDRGGRLSGLDALDYISWGRWVTLVAQVMPVFFVVGGYVNARLWTACREQGGGWASWARPRAMRLMWPTVAYVAVAILAVVAARRAGVSAEELAQVGWLVAFQLWFLPVYLLLIALTPVLLAAHRRWGLAVPAVMAAAAALVDVGVIGGHLPLIAYANYLLVWGAMHQWGFAWQDGTLTRARWRPWALAVGAAAVLAALLTWGPFPVDMIGANERNGNTTPPSIALLAFAAAQTGLILAAEPAVSRWLAKPRRWRLVTRLNRSCLTVYLWHMVPVVIVAVALYPTAVLPQPAIGPGAAGGGGQAGPTTLAAPADRARNRGSLVRPAAPSRPCRHHVRPGPPGHRRIRPRRVPARTGPGRLRRRRRLHAALRPAVGRDNAGVPVTECTGRRRRQGRRGRRRRVPHGRPAPGQ
jgi:fucose 4-O-acetylase-like acetyltransferase